MRFASGVASADAALLSASMNTAGPHPRSFLPARIRETRLRALRGIST